MFQLNTFHFWLFSKVRCNWSLPNICGSNHDPIIRTRDLSRSIPLPLILRESERSFSSLNLFIWNLGSSTSFLFNMNFFFPLFFFISFLKSHRFDPVEFDHWTKGTKSIRLIFRSKVLCEIFGFFLFLYPYPIGTESIENLFFCMNRSYSIPIPSRYLPRKISNWIPNWRVSVSLSMQLCTLRIGIRFLKDPGFRTLVGLRDPFDDLCCVDVEGISI